MWKRTCSDWSQRIPSIVCPLAGPAAAAAGVEAIADAAADGSDPTEAGMDGCVRWISKTAAMAIAARTPAAAQAGISQDRLTTFWLFGAEALSPALDRAWVFRLLAPLFWVTRGAAWWRTVGLPSLGDQLAEQGAPPHVLQRQVDDMGHGIHRHRVRVVAGGHSSRERLCAAVSGGHGLL